MLVVQQLLDGMPPGAIELSTVPGLNLKKIIALHDALGIESVADLKTACQEGLVSKVKGFGLKSQAKLLSDIESLRFRKMALCCSVTRWRQRSEFSSICAPLRT